jgi:hypothetical protein
VRWDSTVGRVLSQTRRHFSQQTRKWYHIHIHISVRTGFGVGYETGTTGYLEPGGTGFIFSLLRKD